MKSKNRVSEGAEAHLVIPLQVKIGGATREKMKLIAAKNGLSLNDVASLCLAAGLFRVEQKLSEIRKPDPETAQAA